MGAQLEEWLTGAQHTKKHKLQRCSKLVRVEGPLLGQGGYSRGNATVTAKHRQKQKNIKHDIAFLRMLQHESVCVVRGECDKYVLQ